MTMPLVDLAIYERFYSVRSNYAREKLNLGRSSRESSRVGCL